MPRPIRLAALALLALGLMAAPSFGQASGSVRIEFVKAGVVVGASTGRGVLTYRGRDYSFRLSGISLGIAAGGAAGRLEGDVTGLREIADFPGTYEAVGGSGALLAGVGGVQLRSKKGVVIALRGEIAGLEFAANRSRVRISMK